MEGRGSRAAWQFLQRPHAELDDTTPIDAAKTEFGGRLAESLLRSIQFGLHA